LVLHILKSTALRSAFFYFKTFVIMIGSNEIFTFKSQAEFEGLTFQIWSSSG